MVRSVEKIIKSIHKGDQDKVQSQLDDYNLQNAECFFFNREERERRKQEELEQFRLNKIRDYVPDSDSDDLEENPSENPEIINRQRLAEALLVFVSTRLQPGVLRTCLRTLRILSRDRQALVPYVNDPALLTLARLSGIWHDLQEEPEEEEAEERQQEVEEEDDDLYSEAYSQLPSQCDSSATASAARAEPEVNPCEVVGVVAEVNPCEVVGVAAAGTNGSLGSLSNCSMAEGTTQTCCLALAVASDSQDPAGPVWVRRSSLNTEVRRGSLHTVEVQCRRTSIEDGGAAQHYCPPKVTDIGRGTRGQRDPMMPEDEEEEKEEDGDVSRREAMKALCNVIYNSQRAQERASHLRLLPGLVERLKRGFNVRVPPSGQFYELRLLFLLTALRPELRGQLQRERGVSMLIAGLEQCLDLQWSESHQVSADHGAPLITKEAAGRAIEILKTIFNMTYCLSRQEADEEDTALYRHLAAVCRHCLLRSADGMDLTEELQGHTVNVLSSLPLKCLDVLLNVPLSPGSIEWEGVNMDCVHSILLLMEKRLNRCFKLKEGLVPVLNLLTESSRFHRETRRYLKQQILPPLRDVGMRPEQSENTRGRLVRLMTHVDTEVKHCAADLLFVLCKENVSRFVKYTGYGNAAGLLASKGLLAGARPGSSIPQHYSSDSDSDTEEYREARGHINLVTGRVEEEQPDPFEGMTEEEKEEEARKLIDMFNRLDQERVIQPMRLNAQGDLTPMGHCALDEEEEDEEMDQ